MKIEIKAVQDYGTHKEELKEEYDFNIIEENEKLTIEFKNGKIEANQNKITYIRNQNIIIIEPGKTNICEYNTAYGKIYLEIIGEKIEIRKEPIYIKTKYIISAQGIPPYTNELEISQM